MKIDQLRRFQVADVQAGLVYKDMGIAALERCLHLMMLISTLMGPHHQCSKTSRILGPESYYEVFKPSLSVG